VHTYRPLKLVDPTSALADFLGSIRNRLGSERVRVDESCGRILAEPVYSDIRIPPRDIAAMDGYALRSTDVSQASRDKPVKLRLVGELAAASTSSPTLRPGEAMAVSCGAPIPRGADAVVRVEHVRQLADSIEVYIDVPKGKNISYQGEDIKPGKVFDNGHLVRPQDIELMTAIGIDRLKVIRRPKAAIISTGDELSRTLEKAATVCSHAYGVAAMLRTLGADPVFLGIARDHLSSIRAKLREGLRRADFLITIAGVSVGDKDLVAQAIQSLSGSRVIAHGVAIHPGRPLTLSTVSDKPIVSLPGHVASTVAAFYLVIPSLLRVITGTSPPLPTVRAKLTEPFQARNLLELVRVRLEKINGELVAKPLTGRINLMRLICESNGLFVAGPRAAYNTGDQVQVMLYSPYEFAHIRDHIPAIQDEKAYSVLDWI